MLIDYTKANVLTIPISLGNEAGVPVEVDHIRLVPGINEVKGEKWGKVSEQINIKRMIEDGHISVLSGEDDSDTEFAIVKSKIPEAVKIIKKTYDLLLLEQWKVADSRPGVVRAIQSQIAEVEERTKPRAKAANE